MKNCSIFHLILLFSNITVFFLLLVSNRGGFIDYVLAPAHVCMSSTRVSSQNLRVSSTNTVNSSFIHFLNTKCVHATPNYSAQICRGRRVLKSIVRLREKTKIQSKVIRKLSAALRFVMVVHSVRRTPLSTCKSSKEVRKQSDNEVNNKKVHSKGVRYLKLVKILNNGCICG